jgi:hypothetical protein
VPRTRSRQGARAHLREAATLALEAPQPLVEAVILVGFGLVALGRADAERAAFLLGATDAIRDRYGVTPVGAELGEAELIRATVRRRLSEGGMRSQISAGRALAAGEALRTVLA